MSLCKYLLSNIGANKNLFSNTWTDVYLVANDDAASYGDLCSFQLPNYILPKPITDWFK